MINSTTFIRFMDFSIFNGHLNDLPLDGKTIINTINQYSFCITRKDHEFKEALQNSDILLPDGIAIVAAVRILNGQKIKKIAGADIHQHLLNELNKKGGKCFYLGASEKTLIKIRERIAKEFPAINVRTYSPPFKPEFSDQENKQMANEVNAFKPDVLFVGMTAPKQEKWANKNKEQLDAKIICSIGAVFDFYAGTVVRPHPFWIKLGLEWFIRLIKEPKRMWSRYMYYGPVFIKVIIGEKLRRVFN